MIEQLRALFPGPRPAAPASEPSETDGDFLDWMQQSAQQDTEAPPDGMMQFLQQFGLPAQPLPPAMASAALVGMKDETQPVVPETDAPGIDLLAALPPLADMSQSDGAIQIAPLGLAKMAVPEPALPPHAAPNPPHQVNPQSTAPPDPAKIVMPDQHLAGAPPLLDSMAPPSLPVQTLVEPMMKPIAVPPIPPADPNRSQSQALQQVPVADTADLDMSPRLTSLAPVALATPQPDRAPTPTPTPSAPEMAAQITVTDFAPVPPQTPSAPRRDPLPKALSPRGAAEGDIAPATPEQKPVQTQFTQAPAGIEHLDAPRTEVQPADLPGAQTQLRTADQPRLPPLAPANLTGQLLQHAATAIERQVEVVLSPEELGRVKFQIRHHGDQVTILLTAERIDTMEMLKRHGEDLMREFRQAGFAGASLDFGRWGQQQQSQQQAPASFALAEDFTLSSPTPRPLPHTPHLNDASGLNIRL